VYVGCCVVLNWAISLLWFCGFKRSKVQLHGFLVGLIREGVGCLCGLWRCAELGYQFIVVLWSHEKQGAVTRVFGRFDGSFGGVYQRFSKRFVFATARVFRRWFLEMAFWFWCLVFYWFRGP
jgi:hypothetical protein